MNSDSRQHKGSLSEALFRWPMRSISLIATHCNQHSSSVTARSDGRVSGKLHSIARRPMYSILLYWHPCGDTSTVATFNAGIFKSIENVVYPEAWGRSACIIKSLGYFRHCQREALRAPWQLLCQLECTHCTKHFNIFVFCVFFTRIINMGESVSLVA